MINKLKANLRRLERYSFYRKSQYWSREQIEQYQDKKLIEIIRHAGIHIPYYRNLFQEIGLDINSFRGRQDMDKIPLLDKEMVRKNYSAFIADYIDQNNTKWWRKTSGSTGTPLKFMLDEQSSINKSSVVFRAYQWAGYRIGMKIFLLKGLSESKPKDYDFELSKNMYYLNSSRLTKENCIAVGEKLIKFRPKFFAGYVRSFIDFYKYINEAGIPAPKPKGIFCYGETVTPDIRAYIEKAYSSKLYDFYSLVENVAAISQMPDNQMYMTEDFFFPELVDHEGNKTASDYGELIATSFYNYSMPFIRYKTRDMIKLADPTREYRYALKPVEFIEGRVDDYILLPDGRKIYYAEGALGYAKGIVAAQYIQDRIDHLKINLIIDDDFMGEYYHEIEKGLQKRIGQSIKVDFAIVDELEKKGSGKTPFIIRRI
jgi:phenylacetate-CoA ligase